MPPRIHFCLLIFTTFFSFLFIVVTSRVASPIVCDLFSEGSRKKHVFRLTVRGGGVAPLALTESKCENFDPLQLVFSMRILNGKPRERLTIGRNSSAKQTKNL